MKWRILIGILLLIPVTYVNAQNPDIGIEVRETLYFGNWTPTSNCWNCIVEIKKGANKQPKIEYGANVIFDNVWYAAEVRLYYISNGSNKPIHITSFQHAAGTLYNTTGSGQLGFQPYSHYWNEVDGTQQYVLSPSNPEVIYYIGGAVQFNKETPAGIYTNNAIPVTIGYWY